MGMSWVRENYSRSIMNPPSGGFEEQAKKLWEDCPHSLGACEECIAAALASAVAKEREADCKAIQDSCSACNGKGFIEGIKIIPGHGCGGDEQLCQSTCPIPIPEPSQEPCEYCGRPIAAIRSRK